MTVMDELEARTLKIAAELGRRNVPMDTLITIFDGQHPAHQITALMQAGVKLFEIGYGLPSEKTTTLFGPDGSMTDPEEVIIPE